MTWVAILSWWILIQAHDDAWRVPRAIGPYPSAEVCRLAGHALMPEERRFWTSQERLRKAAADREAQLAHDAELAEKRAALKGRAGRVTLADSSTYEIDEQGEIVSITIPAMLDFGPFAPLALTGCVVISEDDSRSTEVR